MSSKYLDTQQEKIPDYFWPPTGKWGIRGMKPLSLFQSLLWTNVHQN
jgi:hypothetical protein